MSTVPLRHFSSLLLRVTRSGTVENNRYHSAKKTAFHVYFVLAASVSIESVFSRPLVPSKSDAPSPHYVDH